MFPVLKNGAGDRIRTGDIDLGKVALYQLSYSREGDLIYARKRTSSLSRDDWIAVKLDADCHAAHKG